MRPPSANSSLAAAGMSDVTIGRIEPLAKLLSGDAICDSARLEQISSDLNQLGFTSGADCDSPWWLVEEASLSWESRFRLI